MDFYSIKSKPLLCKALIQDEITNDMILGFHNARLCSGYSIRTVYVGISAINTLRRNLHIRFDENHYNKRVIQAFSKIFWRETDGCQGLTSKQMEICITWI